MTIGCCLDCRAASQNRPRQVQNISEPATKMMAAIGRAHDALDRFEFAGLVAVTIVHLHKDFFEVEVVD